MYEISQYLLSLCLFVCVCLCISQTPRCPDAGVSSLPHLRVPVHGPEEVPGLYPLWPVHGPYAGQGNYVFVIN